jgi:stage II sporulation protein D
VIRLGATALIAGCLIVLLFVLHACLTPPPPRPDPDPLRIEGGVELRVLLSWPSTAPEGVSLVVEGGAKLTAGDSGGGAVEIPAGTYAISVDGDGLRIGERRWAERSLRVDFESGRFRLAGKDPAGKARDAAYRGRLRIHRDGGGLLFVNLIKLDDYLMGVVGREMSLQSDLTEALKAQVVAARTYALYERSLPRPGPFQLYDDERSQAYGGLAAETDLAREVVEATRGYAVLFQNRIVPTFYSSTCGGETEPAWEVLDNVARMPPLRGAACGQCEASPHFRWTERVSRAALAQALFGRPGTVEELRVERRAKGGHALEVFVRLRGESGGRTLEANRGFRHKVGTRTIRSTLIVEILDAGAEIEIRGRGWGHAAGMCQWGAYGMARAGRSSFEILEHYFPGARVLRLY